MKKKTKEEKFQIPGFLWLLHKGDIVHCTINKHISCQKKALHLCCNNTDILIAERLLAGSLKAAVK